MDHRLDTAASKPVTPEEAKNMSVTLRNLDTLRKHIKAALDSDQPSACFELHVGFYAKNDSQLCLNNSLTIDDYSL